MPATQGVVLPKNLVLHTEPQLGSTTVHIRVVNK